MKLSLRPLLLSLLLVIFGASCSSLPGLRVLTGQDAADPAALGIENTELVMADKSGNTDPALIAAADRIELAMDSAIDIIELRKDLTLDVFDVYMLIDLPQDATQAQVTDLLRRTVEVTWQGTLEQSQGADFVRVFIMFPGLISSIDEGPIPVGEVVFQAQIAREDIITFFRGQHTLQDFSDLIVDGKLNWGAPDEQTLYNGTPNHPVFLLRQLFGQ
jgi:hypothetical protein